MSDEKKISRAESLGIYSNLPKSQDVPSEGSLLPAGTFVPESSEFPSPLNVPRPTDDKTLQGLIAQYRLRSKGRKAALEYAEMYYNGQLQLLDHKIKEGLRVGKRNISQMAEERLRELDAEHIRVLTELGIRNAEQRCDALEKLTDTISAKMKRIENKDWDQPVIDEVLKNYWAIRQQVCGEIMKGLVIEYGD
jgi:hypothetical protein